MSRGVNWVLWSKEEDEKLTELCEGKSIRGEAAWFEIATNFRRRSAMACQQRWLALRRMPDGTLRDRARERITNGRIRQSPERTAIMQQPVHVPQYHASIAAAIFGDPLPGRSALDRRNSA